MKRTKATWEKIQAVLNEAEKECSLQEMALDRASCGNWPAPETDSDFLAWWLDEIQVQKGQIASHPEESERKPYIENLEKYSDKLRELGVKPSRLPWEGPEPVPHTPGPYRVKWEIDIEADSPRQAALKALKIQRDRNSMATVFEVNGEEIDLSETKDVAPAEDRRQTKVAKSKPKGGEKQ